GRHRGEEDERIIAVIGKPEQQPVAGGQPLGEESGGNPADGKVEFAIAPTASAVDTVGEVGDDDEGGLVGRGFRGTREAIAGDVESLRDRYAVRDRRHLFSLPPDRKSTRLNSSH